LLIREATIVLTNTDYSPTQHNHKLTLRRTNKPTNLKFWRKRVEIHRVWEGFRQLPTLKRNRT